MSRIYIKFLQLKHKKNVNNSIKIWAKDLDRHFSKANIQMANKHMKRHSRPLVLSEVQVNHNEILLQTHQGGYNNKKRNKWKMSFGKNVEKLRLMYIADRNVKWCQQLWKPVRWFLKRLNIELLYDLAIFLSICTKELKTSNLCAHCR